RHSESARPERRVGVESLRAANTHAAHNVNTQGKLTSSKTKPPVFAGERSDARTPPAAAVTRPTSRSLRVIRRLNDHQPTKKSVSRTQPTSCVMKLANMDASDQRAVSRAAQKAATARSAGQGAPWELAARGSGESSRLGGSGAALVGSSML